MATSFAAYASQYFNKPNNGASTLSSSSQPMFFSFTTEDGSQHGGHDTDLDDMDDPHLRESGLGMSSKMPQDEEDPYLRLDEDEDEGRTGFHRGRQQSRPLIARSPSPEGSVDSPPGWLAHLAAASPQRRRSPSPAPSSSSDSGPPADLLVATPPTKGRAPPHQPKPSSQVQPPPRTQHNVHSLSLTDSLLPRDGRTRPLDVFSLPDPRHTPRKRRKHHDSAWTAVWLGCVTVCTLFCIILLFVSRKPKNVPSKRLPYTVFLHTVPLLTILTFISATVAYAHIWLLRVFVKPVMVATSVFIPATLFISAVWAFIGSFMWDGDEPPTWGETVGLRLFSLIPLALSIITGRRLLHLPRQIHSTSSTLTLTTRLLIANPFLLALSPAILLVMLLASLPFATLIFRLLLIGYAPKVGPEPSTIEYHVYAWANWAIAITFAVWLWSWLIARGILRMTCASIIGSWYYADPSALPPPPMSTHTIHAALVRSTGPSLGSIVLASLILTVVHLLSILTLCLQRLPFYLRRIPWVPFSIPVALYIIPGIRFVVGYLEGVTTALSRYALVYTGLTGDPFWPSARRARSLVTGVEMEGVEDEVEPLDDVRRGGRRNTQQQQQRRVKRMNFGSEPPLTMLTISPLTLTFPFALTTYLFVAHTLNAPHLALGAAVIAAVVTALVGLFCVGLVKDAADTLYLCYCIDKHMNEMRREEVFVAFEYDGTGPRPEPRQGRRVPGQPETIVPRPPAGRQEVLFDANTRVPDEDDSDADERERLIAMGVRSPPKTQPQPIRQAPQQPMRNVPLSPSYLEDRTPTQSSSRYMPHIASSPPSMGSRHPPPVREESLEDDDLNPFRKSTIDENEDLEKGSQSTTRNAISIRKSPGPTVTWGPGSAGTSPKSPPSFAAVGFGHRRIGSGGATIGVGGLGLGFTGPASPPREGGLPLRQGRSPALPRTPASPPPKMMTSAEMNMKSQFLMNMRPYGDDSEVMEMTTSGGTVDRSQVGGASMGGGKSEADDSDGDDSVAGPGSAFFHQ